MPTPTKTKSAPMTRERIASIVKRATAIHGTDADAMIWTTIGGAEAQAEWNPNTRIRDFFRILEDNVAKAEQKIAARRLQPAA